MKIRIRFDEGSIGYSYENEPDVLNLSWVYSDKYVDFEKHEITVRVSCEEIIPFVLEYEYILCLIEQMFNWDISFKLDRLMLTNSKAHRLAFQELEKEFGVK